MKKVLLTLTLLLNTVGGFGQCPTTLLTLTTQAEVDNFAVDYPNCTFLDVQIRIEGPDIVNLNGFSGVTGSGPNAWIDVAGTSIIDFQGFNNFTEMQGQFLVSGNNNLTSFSGLENLQIVHRNFSIVGNAGLVDLNGLESLHTCGATLRISDNQNLESLDGLNDLSIIGLENINSVGVRGLIIDYNLLLTSIEALENVGEINGGLSLLDNNILPNFNGLHNITSIAGHLLIENNELIVDMSGLNSLNQIGFYLEIRSNGLLENLNALDNLVAIDGGLRVRQNPNLTSIAGLRNISPITLGSILSIEDNNQLSNCAIDVVCDNISDPDLQIFINGNLTGCATISEVEFSCLNVFIPDSNFLNALLNYTPVIDANNDDLIQFDEAEAFNGLLNVANQTIFDFTGLEAFVNITGFNGSGNFMSSLSLVSNTGLTSVDFSDSPDLETVNLKNGNNTAITSFNGATCPSLEFVCVDDVAFAEANFTNIDAQVQFVDNCEFLATPTFSLKDVTTLFPNPVSEIVTVSLTENFNYIGAEVYSVSGQKLLETSAKQINMSDLSAGIYFVKVNSEQGTITKKIVKQ